MKRILLACVVGWAAGVAGLSAAPSAAEVEQLKKDFPRHLAPGEVEKLHPVAREYWERFHGLAQGLQPDLISKQAVRIAEAVTLARAENQRNAGDPGFALGHAGRAAARANVRWIDQKVLPWAKRVAAAARK